MSDFNRYVTGNDIVQSVMGVLGLPVPSSASGSTESNVRQMWGLLSECGLEILDQYEWQIKTKTLTLTVQAPTLEYDLPSDLVSLVPTTGWNRTSRIPLQGPLDSQIWAVLQARNLGGSTFALQYVIENDKIKFYYAPSDPQTVTMEYTSRGWVRDGSSPTTFRDFVQNDADVVLFPKRLMMKKLLLEWRKKKGFQTTDDQKDYDRALEDAKYNDRPRRDLGTSGMVPSYPLLGAVNTPDTGFGYGS